MGGEGWMGSRGGVRWSNEGVGEGMRGRWLEPPTAEEEKEVGGAQGAAEC